MKTKSMNEEEAWARAVALFGPNAGVTGPRHSVPSSNRYGIGELRCGWFILYGWGSSWRRAVEMAERKMSRSQRNLASSGSDLEQEVKD